MSPTDKKLRILIADDVQETRRNTRLMLAAIDHVEVVAIAPNGKQAVEMVKEQRPDIVIMDVNMPEMDGLTAFKHILQAYPQTGCILISGEKSPVTESAAQALGIRHYLAKPFIIEELEAAIQDLAQKMPAQASPPTTQSQKIRINALEQTAFAYMREGRTDAEATQVFEKLAENPACETRWLEALAMIYAIQQEWGKLKSISVRLEQKKK
ncbi:MAG: response regulator [Anaerolineales bacterium]|nr:response regulator [Anaerolineales bacterium]